MKYVQEIPAENGGVYLYLRKKGLPRIALQSPLPPPGEEAGSALELEVKAWLAQLAPAKALPGTLRQATRAYELENHKFKILGEETKAQYRSFMKEFDQDLGNLPIAAFTPAFVNDLMNAWADRGHRAANLRRQCLKNVLKPCLVAGTLTQDPFSLVGEVSRPRTLEEPHIVWPICVVEAAIMRCIRRKNYGLARAIAIGRYVGARRGDLVVLTKAARRQGRFAFLSGKKRVSVDQIEDPELTAWLATIPAAPSDEARRGRKLAAGAKPLTPMTLVFNLEGKRYTEDGLGQELKKVIEQLAREGAIDGDAYDLHGLRHTRGVEAALSGCTDAEGAALLGHSSPSSFAQYRRQADRLRLSDNAAEKIAALRERTPNAGVKPGVKKV